MPTIEPTECMCIGVHGIGDQFANAGHLHQYVIPGKVWTSGVFRYSYSKLFETFCQNRIIESRNQIFLLGFH